MKPLIHALIGGIMYPNFIATYADDVYKFIKENDDGTVLYESFSKDKLNIKLDEIGLKYRPIK